MWGFHIGLGFFTKIFLAPLPRVQLKLKGFRFHRLAAESADGLKPRYI